MRVAVISDLHLGARSSTCEFGHDDSEFLRFLKHLEGNFEKIVLLGDIFETLTAPSPLGQLREFHAAQHSHPELAERFRRPSYVYVHGNHDLVAKNEQGALEEFSLQADGVRMLFSHGHQGDRLCFEGRALTEVGVWTGAWIRRMGLGCLYSYCARLERGRNQDPEHCSVRRWALDEADRRSADVVITGHTHVPIKAEAGSTLFLNSGSCAHGEFSFLSLDTHRGEYGVHSTI